MFAMDSSPCSYYMPPTMIMSDAMSASYATGWFHPRTFASNLRRGMNLRLINLFYRTSTASTRQSARDGEQSSIDLQSNAIKSTPSTKVCHPPKAERATTDMSGRLCSQQPSGTTTPEQIVQDRDDISISLHGREFSHCVLAWRV